MQAHVARGLCAAVLVLGLGACGQSDPGPAGAGPSTGGADADKGGQQAAMVTVEGEVFYRERMLLPPGSTVEVQLQDISRADAMAEVLETVQLAPEGGPPYAFTIKYSPARIDSRRRYALRATIANGDRLLFTTTEYIDPFAGNPVQVMVQRLPEPVQRDTQGPLDP